MMLDGSALIQLSGLPEGMTLTECARTEEGLSFTLERSAAYDSSTGQEPEELADLELTLTVSGSVLAADAQTSAGASEIRLDAELESVPLAGTADSRTASAACSISADGEKTENAEEAVPEEESLPEVQSLGDTVEVPRGKEFLNRPSSGLITTMRAAPARVRMNMQKAMRPD